MFNRFFSSKRWHNAVIGSKNIPRENLVTVHWRGIELLFSVEEVFIHQSSFNIARFASIDFSDYLDFHNSQLVDDVFFSSLFSALTNVGADAVLLSNLPTASPIIHFITKMERTVSLLSCQSTFGVICYHDMEQYFDSIGKETCRNLKRISTKLESQPVRFEIQELRTSDLDWLLQMQSNRAVDKGYEILAQTGVGTVLKGMIPNPDLLFAHVFLENTRIAGMVVLDDGQSLGIYLQAFNRRYQNYYPSLYLFRRLVEYCLSLGYRYLDLLRGEETYKKRFCNNEITMTKLLIEIKPTPYWPDLVSHLNTLIE